MLSIAFFGVTCEVLTEEEETLFSFTVDHFSMTRQDAEAADSVTSEENSTQTEKRSWTTWSPDQESWWQKRQRRRKKRTAFSITEFADLSDGRRVIVRSDRGFSPSWKHSPGPFHGDTQESFVNDIHDFFADEELTCCPFSPEWVIERLQRLYGLEIDPASIQAARQVPLQVELGPRLLEQLPQ